jgi:hypothetical protein
VGKEQAFLFGPFVGSLSWEMYRFAPYAIFLKKKEPGVKLVVITRVERFDLYGQYADILVPLKLRGEESYIQNCFTLERISLETYNLIRSSFLRQYKNRFLIRNIFYPDISGFRFKIKWQFPRDKMDYDFRPRYSNEEFVQKMNRKPVFVDLSWLKKQKEKDLVLSCLSKFDFINYDDLQKISFSERTSLLGCVIELLRETKVVVGNLNSPISHLSILLGVKLVSIDDEMSDDDVHLLNPLNTEVVRFSNVLEQLKETGREICLL